MRLTVRLSLRVPSAVMPWLLKSKLDRNCCWTVSVMRPSTRVSKILGSRNVPTTLVLGESLLLRAQRMQRQAGEQRRRPIRAEQIPARDLERPSRRRVEFLLSDVGGVRRLDAPRELESAAVGQAGCRPLFYGHEQVAPVFLPLAQLADDDAAVQAERLQPTLAVEHRVAAQRVPRLELDFLFDNRSARPARSDDDHVIDQNPRALADCEHDVGPRAIAVELRSWVDGRVLVAGVEVTQDDRVAIGGKAREDERAAGLKAKLVEHRRFRDGSVAGDLHRSDDRTHAFANGNGDVDGNRSRRRRLRLDFDVGLRGSETRTPVDVLDRRRLGIERGLRERLTLTQAQHGLQILERHRGVATDRDLGDPILLSARHVERDDELSALLGTLVRGPRVLIALRLQRVLDSRGRVFEQVFVDGPFALNRHQIVLGAGK